MYTYFLLIKFIMSKPFSKDVQNIVEYLFAFLQT